MAIRKFTLSLTGLPDLAIERIRRVQPTPQGFTGNTERSINGVLLATAGVTQTLNLTIDAAMNQSDFALFADYLFEQERNGNRGNILVNNQYTPVNSRWSTINSRQQIGAAQALHGSIAQYFVRHPALIVVSGDFWDVAGENNEGQWKNTIFEIEEII